MYTVKKNKAAQLVWNITKQIFAYIYDFLFNWEDEPFAEETFIKNEKLKHSAVKSDDSGINPIDNNSTVSIKNKISEKNLVDYKKLKDSFGIQTANYIAGLRQEIDSLVEKHGLIRETTIMVVIPPEKMRTSLLGPEFFESTLERLYPQFEKDVILRPGNIRIVNTKNENLYAEIKIEAYAVNEEVLASV